MLFSFTINKLEVFTYVTSDKGLTEASGSKAKRIPKLSSRTDVNTLECMIPIQGFASTSSSSTTVQGIINHQS